MDFRLLIDCRTLDWADKTIASKLKWDGREGRNNRYTISLVKGRFAIYLHPNTAHKPDDVYQGFDPAQYRSDSDEQHSDE